MQNIFVPSKNRVNAPLLINAFENEAHITVVVEPQDFDKYFKEYECEHFNWFVLPENDKGITYARNCIKNFAENTALKTFWQLDDDIKFFYREGTRMIKTGFEVLEMAAAQFKSKGLAIGGLEYQQFAWSATKPLIENSFCDSCVWFDTEKIKDLAYREDCKEDRDFAMQVIKSGEKTGRTTLYAFGAPKNGSNAGGLKEIFYDKGLEPLAVKKMVEMWGDEICIPITKPDGRQDVKIMWNKITSTQQSLF